MRATLEGVRDVTTKFPTTDGHYPAHGPYGWGYRCCDDVRRMYGDVDGG